MNKLANSGFRQLQVYADESGTNDIYGQEPGSAVPALCGYVETPEYWTSFNRKWKKILNDYRAPYFHFREFASKHLCSKIESPYFGWSEKKRDAFLYDLAFQASESAVPMGGFFNAKQNFALGFVQNSFEQTIIEFYESLLFEIKEHWPTHNGEILITFDRCKNSEWLMPINKIHSIYAEKDSRIGGLTFEDDRDSKHLPLQAADLLAYATRQQAQRFMENGMKDTPNLRVLDFVLSRNMNANLKGLRKDLWNHIVRLVREDQKRQLAIWAREGNPKKQYFPYEHFPFEKYGINNSTLGSG